jgi:hypothetical protein
MLEDLAGRWWPDQAETIARLLDEGYLIPLEHDLDGHRRIEVTGIMLRDGAIDLTCRTVPGAGTDTDVSARPSSEHTSRPTVSTPK